MPASAGKNLGQHLATASWLGPVIAVGGNLFLTQRGHGGSLAWAWISVLLVGGGLICAIAALAMISRHGRGGVLVPASIGFVLNAVLVAVLGFTVASADRALDLSAVTSKAFDNARPPALPQVVVTHDLRLKDGRSLEGASAYFIELDGRVLLATALHLLGDGGGFAPPLSQTELHDVVASWTVHPRTRPGESTVIEPKTVATARTEDLVLLQIVGSVNGAKPLKPASAAVQNGDVIWLVGCSYEEPQCAQELYPAVVQARDGTFVWAAIADTVAVNGFSGAPAVNGSGAVVGTLVSATSVDEGRETTHVAIEEIRYAFER